MLEITEQVLKDYVEHVVKARTADIIIKKADALNNPQIVYDQESKWQKRGYMAGMQLLLDMPEGLMKMLRQRELLADPDYITYLKLKTKFEVAE